MGLGEEERVCSLRGSDLSDERVKRVESDERVKACDRWRACEIGQSVLVF